MPKGKIEWSKAQTGHATTTLTLVTNADGSVEMETPQSLGGYQARFSNPEEAAQAIAEHLFEGVTQAR